MPVISVHLDPSVEARFETDPVPGTLIIKQIHGAKGYVVSKPADVTDKQGDWLCSFESGLSIGVRVADCTAALAVGRCTQGDFVAAIHAGWRGTAEKIFENFVETIRPHAGWRVWLSPRICQEHFEVGPEVITALGERSKKYTRPGSGDRLYLDLSAFQIESLKQLGAQVTTHPLCTYHQSELFSYRRSKGENPGRHLAWIKKKY